MRHSRTVSKVNEAGRDAYVPPQPLSFLGVPISFRESERLLCDVLSGLKLQVIARAQVRPILFHSFESRPNVHSNHISMVLIDEDQDFPVVCLSVIGKLHARNAV
jgi:hypothetical protein